MFRIPWLIPERRFLLCEVVVEELKLSYYIGETLLVYIYIYTHYGNLISASEQQPIMSASMGLSTCIPPWNPTFSGRHVQSLPPSPRTKVSYYTL